MKCEYGCDWYGKSCSCPPHVPAISECREFIAEYTHVALLHWMTAVRKAEDRFPWSVETNERLLRAEREVFLAGYPRAFVMFVHDCRRCDSCARSKLDCRHPETLRPVPEAMGVDVFSTAKMCGLPIKVVTDYAETMNRYALFLVE
jgi:predicted metal-binding protein